MAFKPGRAGPAALLTLSLLACHSNAVVTVQDSKEGPVVAFDDPKACLQSLSVYRVGDATFKPLWRVDQTRPDACVPRITYGQTPVGLSEDTAPAPLVAGVRYQFAVMGPGINHRAEYTPASTVTPPR